MPLPWARPKLAKISEEELNEYTVYVVLPPDGGFAWVVVFAAFVNNFIIEGTLYSFGNYLPEIADTMNESLAEVALIGSVKVFVFYLFSPINCACVHRFGFRKTAIFGALAAAVGMFVSTLVHSYWWMVGLFGVISGFGAGCTFAASSMIINYYFERYRALGAGLAMCGSSAGVGILTPVVAECVDKFGWLYTFRVHSVLFVVCALTSLVYVKIKPTPITVEMDEPNSTEQFINEDNVSIRSKRSYPVFMNDILKQDSDTNIPDTTNRKRPQSIISTQTFRSRYASVIIGKPSKSFVIRFFQRLSCIKHPKHTTSMNNVRTGPLDRKDIFYSGNLENILEYDPRYTNHTTEEPPKTKTRYELKSKCNWCTRHLIKATKPFIDIELLKSPTFEIILVSMFFYAFAVFIPFTFLGKLLYDQGITDTISKLMICCLAAGNMLGRISAGLVSFLPQIDPSYLLGVLLTLAGVISIIASLSFGSHVAYHISFVALWGFLVGFNPPLRPVIFVKYLGLGKLSFAYGMSRIAMGLGGLIGTPIAALLIEHYGSYKSAFVLSGVLMCISGAEAFMINFVYRIDLKRRNRGQSVLMHV